MKIDWSPLADAKLAEVKLEDDASLRERLRYLAGDSKEALMRFSQARGAELDIYADEIGIKRRKL